MLRSLVQSLSKVRVASTSTSTSISPIQSFLSAKPQPKIELPINQENNDLECMMNKTSRKALKKHRKKHRGTSQNLRRC